MTNKQRNTNIHPQDNDVLLYRKQTSNLIPDQVNRREHVTKGIPISIPTVRSPESFTTLTTRIPSNCQILV
ncbi:unnamed protein product [Cunninghamella blakesleeana]